MTWRPEIVALDVDGTIVDYTNALASVVRDAIYAIRDTGAEIVIATGRAVPGVYDVLDKLDMREGLAVASNGSVVFGVEPFEVIRTVTFDAREAVRSVLEHFPDALIAVEEVGVGYRVNREFPDGDISGQIIIDEVDRMVAEPVTRVVAQVPDQDLDEFREVASGLGLAGTNFYIGYSAWIDMAPVGISKAAGMDVVCRSLGVDPANVLAVGDGNNDLELLEWAGRGVAMGQAPDAVKQVADAVTGSIEEHGLATELNRWI